MLAIVPVCYRISIKVSTCSCFLTHDSFTVVMGSNSTKDKRFWVAQVTARAFYSMRVRAEVCELCTCSYFATHCVRFPENITLTTKRYYDHFCMHFRQIVKPGMSKAKEWDANEKIMAEEHTATVLLYIATWVGNCQVAGLRFLAFTFIFKFHVNREGPRRRQNPGSPGMWEPPDPEVP